MVPEPLCFMATSSGDDSSPATMTDLGVPPPVLHSSNPFSNSLVSSLTIKLDRSNFLAWKSQVLPTVIGHDLDDILLSNVSPPQFLLTGAVNPAYLQWRKKDQLLLSWIRSSMSEGILGTFASYNTSYSVWTALEQKFSS